MFRGRVVLGIAMRRVVSMAAALSVFAAPVTSAAEVLATARHGAFTARIEYDGEGWKNFRVIHRIIAFDDPAASAESQLYLYDCSQKSALFIHHPIDEGVDQQLGFTYNPKIPASGKWKEVDVLFEPVDKYWAFKTQMDLSLEDSAAPRIQAAMSVACRQKPLEQDNILLMIDFNQEEAYFLMSNRFRRVGNMIDYWISVKSVRKFSRSNIKSPNTSIDIIAVKDDTERRKLNVVADCGSGKLGYKRLVNYMDPSASFESPSPKLEETIPQSFGEEMVTLACKLPLDAAASSLPHHRPPQSKSRAGRAASAGTHTVEMLAAR
jgi:hypothetical protein